MAEFPTGKGKSPAQYYVGAKIVHGEPLEKHGCPGYVVRYEDGYVSWSPKEVFEEAYFAVGGDRNRGRIVLDAAVSAIKEAVGMLD
jgi:hypothetical protein